MTIRVYKILMYGDNFVDASQLTHGIYTTMVPTLYSKDTTIGSKIDAVKEMSAVFNENQIENYTKNILQCKLVEVTLQEV